jgi:hypothetical protein
MSRLLSPFTAFIFMEGGDNNANALQNFLSAHVSAIVTWVSNGGRLFINAAPKQGTDFDLGFGVHLKFTPNDYSTTSNNGYALDANHPILAANLQPVGTAFSGGDAFSHAYMTGTGFSNIPQDDRGRPVLVELRYSSGTRPGPSSIKHSARSPCARLHAGAGFLLTSVSLYSGKSAGRALACSGLPPPYERLACAPQQRD